MTSEQKSTEVMKFYNVYSHLTATDDHLHLHLH